MMHAQRILAAAGATLALLSGGMSVAQFEANDGDAQAAIQILDRADTRTPTMIQDADGLHENECY